MLSLHEAVIKGLLNIVKDLVEKQGADVKAKEYGNTALHWASWYSYTEIVEFLVANGADVNARDKDGNTVLHWTVQEGHIEVVNF